jgi:hypothetical protein
MSKLLLKHHELKEVLGIGLVIIWEWPIMITILNSQQLLQLIKTPIVIILKLIDDHIFDPPWDQSSLYVYCPPSAPIVKTVASFFFSCFFNDLEDSLYDVRDELLLDKVLVKEILLDVALLLEELLLLENLLL